MTDPSPAQEDAASNPLGQNVQGDSTPVKQPPDNEEFPPTRVALTVMTANLLAMFLVSLDRTIIATAIPYITDEFDSIDDISWYGSAYLLASASLQLFYGRIYKFYSVKNIFLASICLFEVGSAVCGAAPNSIALIIGRAIAGAGSAGVMSGIMQILVYLVPLSKRPIYTGFFGAIFGISSIIGPLLGGAFTQRLSWRWCFYINLPFAAVSIPAVVFLVKDRAPVEAGFSFIEKVNRLDPIGSVIFVPCIVSLILALQWGGVVYPWGSARIIALLVVFGLLLLTWLAIQAWKKENATVPPRILLRRSIAAGLAYATLVSGSLLVLVYYMPIWFQAIKGDSPIKSGIATLPSVLGMVVSSIFTGIFTQKVGYYVPTMITGPIIASIGAGLLTTLKTTTNHPHWIGYQFIYGFGIGMGIQQAMLAAQTILPGPDVSIGIALMIFGQQLGGSIWLAVAQNIFLQQLTKAIAGIGGLDSDEIVNTGVTELRNIVPPELLTRVLSAYNTAISHTWYVAIALSSTMLIPALCMEWKSIKGKGKGGGGSPDEVNKTEAKPNLMDRSMSSAEKIQPTDASATSTSDSQSAKKETI